MSIRSLFAVTALCAVLLGAWRAFIYEPPTHRIPLYEKAPSTLSLAKRVGPNTIAIKSVARNGNDGWLAIETGAGVRLAKDVPGRELMAACSKWMDVAQIELRPGVDRFEIIEARVFDHETHTLLSDIAPAFGCQVINDNVLQVYGIGKEIPASLDVWLRVHSYGATDERVVLAPISGSTASIPGATVSISAVQDGFAGWNSATGFAPVGSRSTAGAAIVLTWSGSPREQHYQVAATSIYGEKEFHDRYVNMGQVGEGREVITFHCPLNEIEHIELRPHGGRHRFFFEAVQLPRSAAGRRFDPPPTVHLPVNQKEIQTVLPEFAPLRVRIAVMPGCNSNGIFSSGAVSSIQTAQEPTDVDKSVTVFYQVQGVSRLPVAIHIVGSGRAASPFRSRQHRAFGSTHQVAAETYSIPLGQVDAIDVSMPAVE